MDFQLVHSATLRGTVRKTQWLSASAVIAIVGLAAGVFSIFGIPRTIRRNLKKQMRSMFDETFPPGTSTSTRLEARDDGLGGASGLVIPKQRIIEGDLDAFHRALRARVAVRAT